MACRLSYAAASCSLASYQGGQCGMFRQPRQPRVLKRNALFPVSAVITFPTRSLVEWSCGWATSGSLQARLWKTSDFTIEAVLSAGGMPDGKIS